MAGFESKVIAITGAASGMGRSTAELLHARGATVALADVQRELLEEVAANLEAKTTGGKSRVSSTIVDVRKSDQVNAWIQDTVQRFGKLDGAANVAGVFRLSGDITETSDEDWEFVMGVNATGVFNCLRAELKVMEPGGSVVNFSSVAGSNAVPGGIHYCASKHAVIGLTRTAAKEMGSKKIRVNAVAPGLIDTPLLRGASQVSREPALDPVAMLKRIPLERMAQPSEVADLVAYLLSDQSSYVNGSVVTIDAGFTA